MAVLCVWVRQIVWLSAVQHQNLNGNSVVDFDLVYPLHVGKLWKVREVGCLTLEVRTFSRLARSRWPAVLTDCDRLAHLQPFSSSHRGPARHCLSLTVRCALSCPIPLQTPPASKGVLTEAQLVTQYLTGSIPNLTTKITQFINNMVGRWNA